MDDSTFLENRKDFAGFALERLDLSMHELRAGSVDEFERDFSNLESAIDEGDICKVATHLTSLGGAFEDLQRDTYTDRFARLMQHQLISSGESLFKYFRSDDHGRVCTARILGFLNKRKYTFKEYTASWNFDCVDGLRNYLVSAILPFKDVNPEFLSDNYGYALDHKTRNPDRFMSLRMKGWREEGFKKERQFFTNVRMAELILKHNLEDANRIGLSMTGDVLVDSRNYSHAMFFQNQFKRMSAMLYAMYLGQFDTAADVVESFEEFDFDKSRNFFVGNLLDALSIVDVSYTSRAEAVWNQVRSLLRFKSSKRLALDAICAETSSRTVNELGVNMITAGTTIIHSCVQKGDSALQAMSEDTKKSMFIDEVLNNHNIVPGHLVNLQAGNQKHHVEKRLPGPTYTEDINNRPFTASRQLPSIFRTLKIFSDELYEALQRPDVADETKALFAEPDYCVEWKTKVVGRLEELAEHVDISFDRSELTELIVPIITVIEGLPKGICHYDLRPDNIIVPSHNYAMLIDFQKTAIGTPIYDACDLLLHSTVEHGLAHYSGGALELAAKDFYAAEDETTKEKVIRRLLNSSEKSAKNLMPLAFRTEMGCGLSSFEFSEVFNTIALFVAPRRAGTVIKYHNSPESWSAAGFRRTVGYFREVVAASKALEVVAQGDVLYSAKTAGELFGDLVEQLTGV